MRVPPRAPVPDETLELVGEHRGAEAPDVGGDDDTLLTAPEPDHPRAGRSTPGITLGVIHLDGEPVPG
jgi:hypothetical protein